MRAQFQAAGVFLLHLDEMLSQARDQLSTTSPRFQQFVRYMQDARTVLQQAVDESEDPLHTIDLRESRVWLYLASGYMASKYLEKYNDDAMIAYMAAYDELSALPFPSDNLVALGTPLLRGIEIVRDRSPDDEQMFASVERRRRLMMTRFVEGMYVVQFGSPAAGAAHIESGLTSYLGERGVEPTNARDRFVQLSGFTDDLEHETAIRAFAVLAHVKAGNTDQAMRRAIQLLGVADSGRDLTEQLTAAVAAIESPLTGYALSQRWTSRFGTMTFQMSSRYATR